MVTLPAPGGKCSLQGKQRKPCSHQAVSCSRAWTRSTCPHPLVPAGEKKDRERSREEWLLLLSSGGWVCVGFWRNPAPTYPSRMFRSERSIPRLPFLAPLPTTVSSPWAPPKALCFCLLLSSFSLLRTVCALTPRTSVPASKTSLTSSAVTCLQTARLHF